MIEQHTSEASVAGSKNPVILALDTSTAAFAAALMRGNEVLGEMQSLAERNHSVFTVSHIKTLLAENGIGADQLDGIAVGQGPGSYTGVRIAVTLGKTLAWIWKKPLVGVSSLEGLAYGAKLKLDQLDDSQPTRSGTHWYVPLMDARRGQAYTGLFAAHSDDRWERLAPDGIRLMADWVTQLAQLAERNGQDDRPERIVVLGELAVHEAEGLRLRELLEGLGIDVRLLPFAMEGRAIAELGAAKLQDGEQDEVHTFVPNYTQLTEAEVNLNARLKAQASQGVGAQDE
ncbi:tRNA threonylcarbamoyladenosine biosynthesis protein TsaB [Paenibacillus phyllosphaerae]|uniref:tRNA threonylcarbamoyladenosine biosynthesis protein TsaB n=1 Tax=Paenibacillus phyllosphaerae TaxID=274593 RepID=A0A7W5FPC3_9BACL|nr:tRNA (adenosine(37)-N6)-threonylcarbamoyltransferase complex dimerization subunit type 1 TsaB [Paenibacillus phyllosphaerae]MBB3112077.1 tRNA threonylcarbamoyladenosine biosynthesis protein TsaB [Paenibacillus phyllosphaerae]